MNSLLAKATRQLSSVQADLANFRGLPLDSPEMSARKGQITAAMTTLGMTLRDLSDVIGKEVNMEKRNAAKSQFREINDDFVRAKEDWDTMRAQRSEDEKRQQRRQDLLTFRNPNERQQSLTEDAIGRQESTVLEYGQQRVDDFISMGQSALHSLKLQRNTFKGLERRTLDIAQRLGLSDSVIRLIKNRQLTDALIFRGCVLGVLLLCGVLFGPWLFITQKHAPRMSSLAIFENLLDSPGAADSISMDTRSPTPKKPAISYAAMIAQALMDSPDGRLALPEIYAWIQSRYDYYRLASPAWKNSIRHNLSMNRAFCKAEPPPNAQYKCSYWQFAVPTKVKVGSKGKATVSTTGGRPRSRSLGNIDNRVAKPRTFARRFSYDAGTLPILPKPEWRVEDSGIGCGQPPRLTPATIRSTDLNNLLNTDTSTSSSTVIFLSSTSGSGGSPPQNETDADFWDLSAVGWGPGDPPYLQPSPLCPLYADADLKQSWTPPPDALQNAFVYSRDPLMALEDRNTKSPMLG